MVSRFEEVLKEAEEYAKSKGFRLNPNKKIVEMLINELIKNEKKHGARYCPCRPLSGNPEEDKKKICPCFWHEEEIKKQGHCHCTLFVSQEYYEKHKSE